MAASSRTAQYNHLAKILKKHYKPTAAPAERPVLEHLLFASCLENAPAAVAEEAFATLVHNFFDYNEIRVSSVRELAEVLHGLPDPSAAALRVKRVLQNVFEASYSFDLEDLHKLNLGPAVERLEKLGGSKFAVAYVTQAALGGHAIPADEGTLKALGVTGLLSEDEVAAGTLPGVERAIPKNKGIEFGSLLHQLGAEFTANPYAPALQQILLQINPDCKERLPKRRAAKAESPAPVAPPKRSGSKAAAAAAEPAEPAGAKGKKTAAKTPPSKRKSEAEPVASEAAAAPKKKPAATKTPPGKKKPAESKAKTPAESRAKEANAAGLSKRKPR